MTYILNNQFIILTEDYISSDWAGNKKKVENIGNVNLLNYICIANLK